MSVLIKIFLSSTAVMGAVCILDCLFQKKVRPILLYSMWLVVALKLIVFPVPVITSSFSINNIYDAVLDKTSILTGENATLQDSYNVDTTLTSESMTMGDLETITTNTESTGNLNKIQMMNVAGAIVYMMIFRGTVIVMGITCLRFHKLRKYLIRNRKEYHLDAALLTMLEEKKLAMTVVDGVKIPMFTVYEVEHLPSPCYFDHAIYIPSNVVQNTISLESMMQIILHEICHKKHRDVFWSWIRCICVSLYWYNPLAWLSAWLSKRDCEIACDDAVMKILDYKQIQSYGNTILDLIQIKSEPMGVLDVSTQMTGNKLMIKSRVQIIAGNKKFKRGMLFLLATALVVLLCVTMTTGNRLTSLMKYNSSDIKSIQIRNMNTGEECSVTEKRQVNGIIDYLRTVKCQRRFFAPATTGGQYSLTIYSQNGNDIIFFAGGNSTVNDKKYDLHYDPKELENQMSLTYTAELEMQQIKNSESKEELPWTNVDYNYYVSEGYMNQLENGHMTGAFINKKKCSFWLHFFFGTLLSLHFISIFRKCKFINFIYSN